ncbi:MAG: DUF6339 family protein [Oscillospiraceae bacterium]
MKVHFLTENALEALRTNLNSNLKHYSDDTNDWIYDYFGNDLPFKEYKHEFPNFELTYDNSTDVSKSDVKNTITLYSAMKTLTDTEATDERLWAGMCHCDFWKYIHCRWNLTNNSIKSSNINSRCFLEKRDKRSLIKNSLSKLWWVGRLTYDESRTDPFELTKYFENDYPTKALIIFSNNYMSNKNISVGIISALKKLEEEGFYLKNRLKRDTYYEATKYLNVLGGTYILDYFTSEEIEEKVTKYLKSLYDASYKKTALVV